jgi:hypothetical protein
VRRVTVVGGGLGGLVAAIASAEAGAVVEVYEAHQEPGGRARSSDPPYIANDGPHVLYDDGPHWSWLARRGFVRPAARFPWREAAGLRFRHEGRLRRLPPYEFTKATARRRLRAPVDRDFTGWATERLGPHAARQIGAAMGVVTFDADSGRLSAAFVWERFLRVTRPHYPSVRYVIGGWQAMVDRMVEYARRVGVRVHTGARLDRLPEPPVIVATSLDAARQLLGDDSLRWESGRTALLDLGLVSDPRDAFVVFDHDEAGFVERYSAADGSLAPVGQSLVQAQMPLRRGEPRSQALARLERLLDLALPDWRSRTRWRRDGIANGRTGALDLPGTTWRDRPAIDRGDGVYLVGDMVAGPGLLSEVTLSSARQAAHLAAGATAPAVLASR